MDPRTRKMFELGREILKLATEIPIDEFDAWYHFFSQAWGTLYRVKGKPAFLSLLAQFGDVEIFDRHMEHRRRGSVRSARW